MGVMHGLDDWHGQAGGGARCVGGATEQALEISPLHQLHAEEGHVLHAADLIDWHDAGVVELRGGLCLAQESAQLDGAQPEPEADHLHCDDPVQAGLAGAPHDTHTTDRDRLEQLVVAKGTRPFERAIVVRENPLVTGGNIIFARVERDCAIWPRRAAEPVEAPQYVKCLVIGRVRVVARAGFERRAALGNRLIACLQPREVRLAADRALAVRFAHEDIAVFRSRLSFSIARAQSFRAEFGVRSKSVPICSNDSPSRYLSSMTCRCSSGSRAIACSRNRSRSSSRTR